MKPIIIFTDGSARGNPGPGGYGVIITANEKVTELGGRVAHTTNNKMELTAVIEALSCIHKMIPRRDFPGETSRGLPEDSPELRDSSRNQQVILYTDSSYVLNGATKWVFDWQKNNWKTKTKKAVLNQDLWERLADLLRKEPRLSLGTKSAEAKLTWQIEWKHVKGHAGTGGNERCDVIATSFADGIKPKLYVGSLAKYGVDVSVLTYNQQPTTNKKKKNSTKAYSYVSVVNGTVKTHATWAECERRVKGVSGTKFKKSFSKEDEVALIKLWSAKS